MFTSPHLNYGLLAPILIILAGALVGVGVEAFVRKTLRATVQLWVALATVLVAFVDLYRSQSTIHHHCDRFSDL